MKQQHSRQFRVTTNVIELNTLFQMALGKNVIEDAADDKVVRLKNGMLTFVCDPADVTDSINGILNLKKVCDENDTQLLYHSSSRKKSASLIRNFPPVYRIMAMKLPIVFCRV